MENKKRSEEESMLLHQLGDFSRNMVNNHHLDNLSEFVMHDLCSGQGFSIHKAAYLVHNPDFECIKGVAGYYHPESFDQGDSWTDQKKFTAHMKQSAFNQQVRSYSINSSDLGQLSDEKVKELIDYFEMSDPRYHTWESKHNNQGIFLFEGLQGQESVKKHLLSFLHMLSFCPVF